MWIRDRRKSLASRSMPSSSDTAAPQSPVNDGGLMSSSHSSHQRSRWYVPKELLILFVLELIVAYIFEHRLTQWAREGERIHYLGIVIVALIMLLVTYCWKTWHLALLYDLANRPPL